MKDIYLITASFVGEIRRDFLGYLEMTSRAGYSGIEIFNCPLENYTPQEFKSILSNYGLTAISAHVNVENTDSMLRYLPETGCKFIVCPGLPISSRDEAYRAADLFNRLGSKAKTYGLRYGYHNHDNDFNTYGGEMVIDILLQNTDPKLVTFELDAGWAWRAGINAAEFIKSHAGRFDLIHVKETSRVLGPKDDLKNMLADAKRSPNGRLIMTPEISARFEEHLKVNCKLGEGIINMPELKKAADEQGVKAYIVEREYAYTGDNFTTILADRQYLSAL